MARLTTSKAPDPFGPYSQGIEACGLVITSGQIPLDIVSGKIPKGITAQAEQCCKNVGSILNAAGVNFEDVIKTTCFLVNMEDIDTFNKVYARYFTTKPARSCVLVRAFPNGILCEIEAMAIRHLKQEETAQRQQTSERKLLSKNKSCLSPLIKTISTHF